MATNCAIYSVPYLEMVDYVCITLAVSTILSSAFAVYFKLEVNILKEERDVYKQALGETQRQLDPFKATALDTTEEVTKRLKKPKPTPK